MDENQQGTAPPKVSVVIVSFNNAAALRRCLTALEASRGREAFEILVVDSGSMDECPRMDTEFPGINLLRLPRNFGLVKALNIGMRTAVGEFFLFLEPEMEVSPDTVSSLAALLEAAPDAVSVCPLIVSPAGETLTRLHPLPLPAELWQAWRDGDFQGWTGPETALEPIEADYLKPPALMVRGNFMRGLRYIDERYGHHGWDLEICTQIRRASRKILLLPSARAVAHSSALPAFSTGARGLLAADRALGAAVWCGKHYGWFQGFKFRLAATFLSLGRLLGLRDAGYQFSLLSCLLSGQKVDGSQQAL
jgi:GT2 family glycosyltransferase